MAGSMKDIKLRIKSVESTMQITKAMELVASSKMRRAKERVERARGYFNTMYESFTRIVEDSRDGDSAFLRERPVEHSLFIVIAGDRGLAGGYNANVLKMALHEMEGKKPVLITIGRKAQEFFAKRDVEILASYLNFSEALQISDTHAVVDDIMHAYRHNKIDEVYLCYTSFVSPMTQEAVSLRLLPVPSMREDRPERKPALIEYDPSPEAVFDAIIPEFLRSILYGAVVESFASETAARRMAMESASDNASEMIGELELSYNRARQAAITQEITEIVAGSGQLG